MLEEKIFKFSGSKTLLSAIFSIFMLLISILLLFVDIMGIESSRFDSPTLAYGAGTVGFLIFGPFLFFHLRRLFNKSSGVKINSKGIVINTFFLNNVKIFWGDVQEINEINTKKQKIILINITNPEHFIRKRNLLLRMVLNDEMKITGTPINIITNTIKPSHKELLETLQEYHQKSLSHNFL